MLIIFLYIYSTLSNELNEECFELKDNNKTIIIKTNECCNQILNYKETVEFVEFDNSVSSIRNQCFMNFKNLTTINFGLNIKEIGKYAFYSCTSLKSLTIGQGLSSLPSSMCHYCSKLETLIKCEL